MASTDEARVTWLLGGAGPGASSEPPSSPRIVSAEPPAAPVAAVRVATAPARDWRDAARALHVVIYTTSWCGYCRQAKAWMSANGVPYDERDIETSSEDARAMRRLNPRGSVPTFDIGGNTMVGFSEAAFIASVQRASR